MSRKRLDECLEEKRPDVDENGLLCSTVNIA